MDAGHTGVPDSSYTDLLMANDEHPLPAAAAPAQLEQPAQDQAYGHAVPEVDDIFNDEAPAEPSRDDAPADPQDWHGAPVPPSQSLAQVGELPAPVNRPESH